MRFVLWFVIVMSAFAQRRGFEVDDLWQWRTAEEARIRPDGQWVVYRESWSDQKTDRVYSNLWLVSTDGRQRRQYTDGKWQDRSARWSPDGERIAWISDRGGKPAVYVAKFDGSGQVAPAVNETPVGLIWSPEGDKLAILVEVASSEAAPAWMPPAIVPFVDRGAGRRTGIVVTPSMGKGESRRVTPPDFDCQGEPSWMLDGQRLVAAGPDGIYLLGSGGVKALARGEGRYESPVVSSEGGKIAYLLRDARPQSYVVRKLHVMNADGSRGKLLTGTLDRDVDHPQWSSEGRTVYFTADDRGATRVYAARNDGTVRPVSAPAGRFSDFSLADNGRAAATGDEVVTFTVDTVSQPVTLASPNEHLLAERHLGSTEQITWTSDGVEVHGVVVKPAGFDASKKYPLLVDVQDDPRRMCGVEFSPRAQILAAKGVVVLCPNPRGTPGYGEQFGNLLRTRYPGDDFDDVMRGVDALVGKGYIDAKRMALSGGLLAAWAAGHTDRFAKIVARRPIVDWTVDVATAPDGLRRATDWMGSLPWLDPEQYARRSPISYAKNFKTPVLILAGPRDPESEELAFALRRQKVECHVVRIPAGNASSPVLELAALAAWL